MTGFLSIIVCSFLINSQLPAQSPLQQKSAASLRKIFGDTISVAAKSIRLTPAERDSLSHLSPPGWAADSIEVYLCEANNSVVGYGVIDNVKGKTQFITYLVAIRPNGEVQDVDVLVYRESYGGEIAYESFRKQYRGKTARDKLQPGRDIKNISGATISVHAISDGIRKILLVVALLKPRLQHL